MLWPPARITVVLIPLLSTLLPITVDPPFAFASSTLTPTFPSNPLGVSALAGPNIRLQSDRAGSARSLSPRPPSSGIFSERHRPLTALRLAHYVRHVCMSSDGAQPETSCAVDVQLHKSDHVRDRQLCYASESSESLGIFFFVHRVDGKTAISQRICTTLEVVCQPVAARRSWTLRT